MQRCIVYTVPVSSTLLISLTCMTVAQQKHYDGTRSQQLAETWTFDYYAQYKYSQPFAETVCGSKLQQRRHRHSVRTNNCLDVDFTVINIIKQEERRYWSECTEYVWRSGKLVSGQRNGRSPLQLIIGLN